MPACIVNALALGWTDWEQSVVKPRQRSVMRPRRVEGRTTRFPLICAHLGRTLAKASTSAGRRAPLCIEGRRPTRSTGQRRHGPEDALDRVGMQRHPRASIPSGAVPKHMFAMASLFYPPRSPAAPPHVRGRLRRRPVRGVRRYTVRSVSTSGCAHAADLVGSKRSASSSTPTPITIESRLPTRAARAKGRM